MLSLSLLGGLLAGLGFLHVFSPGWRERITHRLRGGAAPQPQPQEEEPEELSSLGGIEVKRLVAAGGMGVVYEGWDAGLKRRVALKRLRGEIRSDPKERERFLAEARTVAALRHPNIVQIFAILEDGGELCLVFEFAEGHTLKDVVAERGPLGPARTLALASDLCAAVGYAHSAGVVHRDLKPENVMLDDQGGAKVMDFGLARAPRAASSTTTVWGSPPYMAPEAEDGEASASSDLYGLGATVYFALVGKPPYSGTPKALSLAKARGGFAAPSKARPGLPAALDAFMAKALNPDPAKRFATAPSFHAALAKALS
jgi:serine/threonine-protein kinase